MMYGKKEYKDKQIFEFSILAAQMRGLYNYTPSY